MDDKNKFLDDVEESILEGNHPSTNKEVEEILEDHNDDVDNDIEDEEDDEIDADQFDERTRRAKKEEIENNRKLVERLNALEDQVNQSNEEKIAKEFEIAQHKKRIYEQEAEKLEAQYKQIEDDIKAVKNIKRDAELKEEKSRVFQAEDALEQLNEARFNLELKKREFAKQVPRDFVSNGDSYNDSNTQPARKSSSKFDITKLDPESRNFVKTNPYMNPNSEHYDQGLVDDTVAIMDDLSRKYAFAGKKAKVYSREFYQEVQEAMHNKYSTADERRRDLLNNPVTGVKRNGGYMKEGRNRGLDLLNNMAKQLIKKTVVRDKKGQPIKSELKAELFKNYNEKYKKQKAQERGYY